MRKSIENFKCQYCGIEISTDDYHAIEKHKLDPHFLPSDNIADDIAEIKRLAEIERMEELRKRLLNAKEPIFTNRAGNIFMENPIYQSPRVDVIHREVWGTACKNDENRT